MQFDFLGKDSIRYFNLVPVVKRVYKNVELFMKDKKGSDDLFDRLNVSYCAIYLIDIWQKTTLRKKVEISRVKPPLREKAKWFRAEANASWKNVFNSIFVNKPTSERKCLLLSLAVLWLYALCREAVLLTNLFITENLLVADVNSKQVFTRPNGRPDRQGFPYL